MRKVDQVFGEKKMYKNQFFWGTISAVMECTLLAQLFLHCHGET